MKAKIIKIKDANDANHFCVVVDPIGNQDPDEFETWTFKRALLINGLWKKKLKESLKKRADQVKEANKNIKTKDWTDAKAMVGVEIDTDKE